MNGHLANPVTQATLAAALGQWLPDLALQHIDGPACDTAVSRALARIPGFEVQSALCRSPAELADYCDLLARLVEEQTPAMTRLQGHLAVFDAHAAEVLAHNLKGIAGLLGAKRIASIAHDIVQGLRTGALAADIAALANDCAGALASLAEALRALPRHD